MLKMQQVRPRRQKSWCLLCWVCVESHRAYLNLTLQVSKTMYLNPTLPSLPALPHHPLTAPGNHKEVAPDEFGIPLCFAVFFLC